MEGNHFTLLHWVLMQLYRPEQSKPEIRQQLVMTFLKFWLLNLWYSTSQIRIRLMQCFLKDLRTVLLYYIAADEAHVAMQQNCGRYPITPNNNHSVFVGHWKETWYVSYHLWNRDFNGAIVINCKQCSGRGATTKKTNRKYDYPIFINFGFQHFDIIIDPERRLAKARK